MARKLWQSPEWRKKRQELIEGKSCVWCGSTEELVIHHKHTFHGLREYQCLARTFFMQYFNDGKHKKDKQRLLAETKQNVTLKYYNTCPKCGYSAQERKTLQPKYRCWRCKITFGKPIRKVVPSSKNYFNRVFYSLFCKKHKEEIQCLFRKAKAKSDNEYKAFINTIILCKKCHYAHHKGLTLCKICKTRYHRRYNNMCWNCFKQTERGKQIIKKKIHESKFHVENITTKAKLKPLSTSTSIKT